MSKERMILNKTNMGIADGIPLQVSEGGIEELFPGQWPFVPVRQLVALVQREAEEGLHQG